MYVAHRCAPADTQMRPRNVVHQKWTGWVHLTKTQTTQRSSMNTQGPSPVVQCNQVGPAMPLPHPLCKQ